MDDFNSPDSTPSNFSVPDLVKADLATPSFSMPDVNRPDPYVPDLTTPLIPDDLERIPVDRPNPALPDLMQPDIPGSLAMPGKDVHSVPNPAYMPEVTMNGRPGELNSSALSLVRTSPDFQRLPSGMDYSALYTTVEDMSTRNRHLGMLELGLESGERNER